MDLIAAEPLQLVWIECLAKRLLADQGPVALPRRHGDAVVRNPPEGTGQTADEALTRSALKLLGSKRNDAYEAALAALRTDGVDHALRLVGGVEMDQRRRVLCRQDFTRYASGGFTGRVSD